MLIPTTSQTVTERAERPGSADHAGRYRLVFGENSRVGHWIEEREGGHYRDGSQCIGLERRGEIVAGALFDYHNGASVYGHIAAVRLTRQFLKSIFKYAFVQLECRVMIGLVAGDNLKSQRLVERLGFHMEHTILDADPSGALHIYTLRREACRWL